MKKIILILVFACFLYSCKESEHVIVVNGWRMHVDTIPIVKKYHCTEDCKWESF